MPSNALKTASIIFFVIGFGIFLLLNIVPVIVTLFMSMQDFMPWSGLLGSPWVGFYNYAEFFNSAVFQRLLSNSLALSLVPAALAVTFALPISLVIGGMEAGKPRSAATFMLLLPAFVPDIILASFALTLLPSSVLADPASFRVTMILLSALKPISLCAFIGACAAGTYNDRGKNIFHGALAGVIVGIAVNLIRFLSSNLELHTLIYHPMVYSTADTFDTFIFHTGMWQFQFSSSASVWIVKTVLQLLAVLVVFLIVLPQIDPRDHFTVSDTPYRDNTSSGSGIILGFLFAAAFLVFLLAPALLAGSHSFPGNSSMSLLALLLAIGNNLLITVFSSILFISLLLILAVWCHVHFGKGTILLILISSAIVNNISGEFLFYRNFGLINSYLPVIFSGIFNFSFVLATAYLAQLKNSNPDNFGSLFHTFSPYLSAFFGVFIANIWGSSFYQMIYMPNQSQWGIPLFLRGSFSSGVGPAHSLILSIAIPVLLFAIVTGLFFIKTDHQK